MREGARQRTTELVQQLTAGPRQELEDRLMDEVYEDLHRLAIPYFRHERPGHTLQPTALVHEAYLRLVDGKTVDWQGRTHFFAVGARVMRRLLVQHARDRGRLKRGGDRMRVTLGPESRQLLRPDADAVEVLDVHRALGRLADLDPRQARIVEMRFFAGMTVPEVAQHLGLSTRTVEGQWTHAKAWLRREIAEGGAA